MDLITNIGIFIYPLTVCSLLAVFVTVERLLALRTSKIITQTMIDALIQGQMNQIKGSLDSVMGRIVSFYREQNPNPEALTALAKMEVSRMERGVFLLEVVIGAAPLLGLLGTVTGLTEVFGNFFAEGVLTNPSAFIGGIAMALNTTILGLAIAIPSLAVHAYLLRRIDAFATQISIGVECLVVASRKHKET